MTIERVVIVGTGLMGPGLALACVAAGAHVRVAGRNEERARAVAEQAGVEAAPLAAETFADADLALETVVEDLDVKLELLPRIEAWLRPEAVLATNTSGFRIGQLAEPLARPERFAGFHFLNPANLTAVVEVIAGPATDDATVEALADLGRRMGKRPLVCRKDVPGFIWNRLQIAVLREALWLLENGVADVDAIDAAIADGLAPRWLAGGPFATADLGGINTFAVVARNLFPELSAAREPGELARRADEQGSFYAWTDESRSAIAELRADTLRTGREVTERRRGVAPPPR